MTVTSASAPPSPWAALSPPKPAPTMTMCGRGMAGLLGYARANSLGATKRSFCRKRIAGEGQIGFGSGTTPGSDHDKQQDHDDDDDGRAAWRLPPEYARRLYRRTTRSQLSNDLHPLAHARQRPELLAGQSGHGSPNDYDGAEQHRRAADQWRHSLRPDARRTQRLCWRQLHQD